MNRVVSLSTVGLLAALAPASQAHDGMLTPLPPVVYPVENPLLPDQDTLGKFLFWDEQLSHDNSVACGTCHRPEAGGSDPRSDDTTLHPGPDGLFGSDDDIVGSPGMTPIDFASGKLFGDPLFGSDLQVTRRLAPSVVNAAYHGTLFWDGRASGTFLDPQTGEVAIAAGGALESQALGPILSPAEMSASGRTWNDVVAKLAAARPLALATDLPAEMADFLAENPSYPDMFAAVYGTPAITARRIAFAIANYERTLVSDETIVDDFLRGDIAFLPTLQMHEGWTLFHNDAMCHMCHVFPVMGGPFHNIGVRPDAEDIGRQAVTGDPADRGKFKVPGLRNAALKPRLFHDGSAQNLKEAIDLYADGGHFDDGNLDPLITPLSETLNGQQLLAIRVLIRDGMRDARVEQGLFPFDRPTLRSELPPQQKRFGSASPDGSGRTAEWIARSPTNIGNEHVLLALQGAVANSPALLAFAFQPDRHGGTPFPGPRVTVPVNLDLATIFLQVPTTTDGDGLASFNLALPLDANLVGLKVYAQWFIADPSQTATGGVYGTRGLAFTLF